MGGGRGILGPSPAGGTQGFQVPTPGTLLFHGELAFRILADLVAPRFLGEWATASTPGPKHQPAGGQWCPTCLRGVSMPSPLWNRLTPSDPTRPALGLTCPPRKPQFHLRVLSHVFSKSCVSSCIVSLGG